MDDRDFLSEFEYVRLLIWTIILAIPTALATLLYLTIYHKGIEYYHLALENLGIPSSIFILSVIDGGGFCVFNTMVVDATKYRIKTFCYTIQVFQG